MWWWTGESWQVLDRYVTGMFGSSTNWVTDWSTRRIVAMGHIATVAFGPSYLFEFSRGAWHSISVAMHPAPANPQYFSLAYDDTVGGIVAFGRSGTRTRGQYDTWELVRAP